MTVYTTTDVGRSRETNEDSVCHKTIDDIKLLAVADGMGGHSAGDVASETALKEFQSYVTAAINAGQENLETIVEDGIRAANEAVLAAAEENPRQSDMGTTIVTAIINDDGIVIGNVGDSRGYQLSTSEITQLTDDHSLVQELVDEGSITEEEARSHPQRNVVTQVLGTNDTVTPDFFKTSLGTDTLLLCSDGLTEELRDDEIREAVATASGLTEAGETLIQRANAKGGSDNISVAMYKSDQVGTR